MFCVPHDIFTLHTCHSSMSFQIRHSTNEELQGIVIFIISVYNILLNEAPSIANSRSFHVPSLSVDWADTRQVTKSLMGNRTVDIFTVQIRRRPARSLFPVAL